MKRFAIIENLKVVNVVLADDMWHPEGTTFIEVPDDSLVEIGWMVGVQGTLYPPEATAPPAPPASPLSALQFIERFTDEEQLAIVTATMSNPAVKLWYDKLMASQEVVLTNPRLIDGMVTLVATGLITEERKDLVLASGSDIPVVIA